MESYLSVRPSRTGEGLFTVRPFKKGDAVCLGKFDYFALSDQYISKACQACTRKLPVSKKTCSKCSLVHYCSQDCQSGDSNLHELECLFAQRVKPNRPTQSQRILLRALKHRSLPSIQFNIDNVDPSLLGYYLHGLKLIKQALSENEVAFSMQQLLRFQCMLKFSCLEMEAEDVRMGVAYSSLLAKVNHSCSPNCVYTLTEDIFALTAVKPVKENEEITISYIGDAPFEEAKEDLKKYFGFSCSCSECNKRD